MCYGIDGMENKLTKDEIYNYKKLIVENKEKFIKITELLKEQKVIYKKDLDKWFF